jgi:hypothetical protein
LILYKEEEPGGNFRLENHVWIKGISPPSPHPLLVYLY